MTPIKADGGVSLAAVRLSDIDLRLAEILDDAERARAKTFRVPAQQDRFLAGRIALRLHIATLTEGDPKTPRSQYFCPTCRNQHGQGHGIPQYQVPHRTSPLRVSLSRSGNWCLLAATLDDDVAGIGVDIERQGSADFEGFESVAMTPHERNQLHAAPAVSRTALRTRLWVRKEAVLKALGTGLAIDPSSIDVYGATPTVPHEPPKPQWVIEDVNPSRAGLPEDVTAALAVRRHSSNEHKQPGQTGRTLSLPAGPCRMRIRSWTEL